MMLCACTWIRNSLGLKFVCAKVEGVADDHGVRFSPSEFSDRYKTWIGTGALRGDERHQTCGSFGKCERSRRNVHFPVTNHDVSVGAESVDTFVFVNVFMIGVQK